jgi:Dolichyl-phosphate-mannose-protein mannosyltransferase
VLPREFRAYDVTVVLAQVPLFAVFAAARFVDGDEGTYTMAAKLVADGRLPYLDFAYGQTPVLPYVYGGWVAAFGESWYGVRALTAAFAVAIGALLYLHLRERAGRAVATPGLAAYATSGLALAWLTPLKTYALSTLLLFAAYVIAERAGPARWPPWAAAGLLAGLAVDTRLMFAAALPAFAWHLWARRVNRTSVAAAFGGTIVGLVPGLALFLADPARFRFDNLGAYAHRSGGGLVGDFGQKARAVANLLGIGTPDGAVPQFLLLVLAAACAATLLVTLRHRPPLAFAVALLLGLASLLPTPTYPQYFVPLVPFLVAGTFEAVAALRDRLDDTAVRRGLAAAGVVALAGYAALALDDFRRYVLQHGNERIGPIERVAGIVDARTEPGEKVVTSWPGYLFGTHALPVEGFETDFGPLAASRLDDEEARRNRRLSASEVERIVRSGESRVVVLKRWHHLPPLPDWERALSDGGYRVVARIPGGSNLEPGGVVLVYAR